MYVLGWSLDTYLVAQIARGIFPKMSVPLLPGWLEQLFIVYPAGYWLFANTRVLLKPLI